MANESDEDFALTLVGDGISIEKKVNRQTAMAVVAAVMGGKSTFTLGQEDGKGSGRPRPQLTPSEFLTDAGASTNVEQITALGHFVIHYEGKENFSQGELRDAFTRAREKVPKNLSRDVGVAINKGLMHEVGKSGRYYVTNTGIQELESKFGRTR